MTPSSQHGDTSPTGRISVWVQPNASRAGIVGLRQDALKISVTVPPEKGKANHAVEKLLAKVFGLPKSSVTVVVGGASRRKTVELRGVSQDKVAEWLEKQRRL